MGRGQNHHVAITSAAELGTILGVWAHPDDEAYLSAGLMAAAVAAGSRVVCVTATRGEAGFPLDDPRPTDELAALRGAELDACLAILGVTDHRYLGFADGHCAAVDDHRATDAVAEIIAAVRPDTVLTFGPDGGTGHPDHIAACRWTTLAVDQLTDPPSQPPRLLYAVRTRPWAERVMPEPSADVFMVDGFAPELVEESELAVHFTCSDELLDRKVAALRAQASQVEPFIAGLGLDVFREFAREETFRDRRPTDRAVTIPNARR